LLLWWFKQHNLPDPQEIGYNYIDEFSDEPFLVLKKALCFFPCYTSLNIVNSPPRLIKHFFVRSRPDPKREFVRVYIRARIAVAFFLPRPMLRKARLICEFEDLIKYEPLPLFLQLHFKVDIATLRASQAFPSASDI